MSELMDKSLVKNQIFICLAESKVMFKHNEKSVAQNVWMNP